MHLLWKLCLWSLGLSAAAPALRRDPPLPAAAANDNRTPAGVLRGGVLTVSLEARRATWYPDGDSLPGTETDVFAEAGGGPVAPGPLLRVPAGTALSISVRNRLRGDTLTFHLPAGLGAAGGGADSVVVLPGRVGTLRTGPLRTGSFAYHAETSRPITRANGVSGLLSGALVVDPPGGGAIADRVFVIQVATDSLLDGLAFPEPSIFTINGRSWPHTEPLEATAGDTLRWKVVNASEDVHPMHLHGFYFRVDAIDGVAPPQLAGVPGRMAVTERLTRFSAMAITWVPERPGNWLFHCHSQTHVAVHRPLAAESAYVVWPRPGPHASHGNHALTGMNGLVMGIRVHPRRGDTAAEPAPGRRVLRLVAVRDSGFAEPFPSMRYVIEERGRAALQARPGFSPTLVLRRGEPVSITVVNHLDEPTAVHWHGMELESYFDGVAGFSGSALRLSPLVEPRDSFEARFTPRRAGTFIYHSHADETRQHRAGLLGALVVRDEPAADSATDLVFFIKSPRGGEPAGPDLDINGQSDPDTLRLRAGERYRLRFIGLQKDVPNATVVLTARRDSALYSPRDSLELTWMPMGKDGADIPAAMRVRRPARQVVSMGETYDFEVVPARPGALRLEVRAPGRQPPFGRLLIRVPIRVE